MIYIIDTKIISYPDLLLYFIWSAQSPIQSPLSNSYLLNMYFLNSSFKIDIEIRTTYLLINMVFSSMLYIALKHTERYFLFHTVYLYIKALKNLLQWKFPPRYSVWQKKKIYVHSSYWVISFLVAKRLCPSLPMWHRTVT